MTSSRALAIASMLLLPACGGEVLGETNPTTTTGTGETTTGTGTSTTTGTSTIDPSEWSTLIDGTWQIPGGTEAYWCTLKTIQEDTYVTALRGLSPQGTHHTLLIREKQATQPDHEFPCGATLGADMIHASGVGTDDLVFPPGVGVLIPAGTQLLLNLHLFNVSASPISGVSGTLVKKVKKSDIQSLAEFILPGTAAINVPPNGSQTTEGTCSFPSATTLITVWPHMHQYGTHMKVTYQGSAGTKVLHDEAFSFGDQKNHPIAPLTVAPGDKVKIACTYQNPTSQTINWGDSSKAEMCFAGLYLHPVLNGGMNCQ